MTTDQLERAFTALGDPTRRRVFELVAERSRSVGDLAGELPVSRPAVSQHLKVLAEAGLVTPRAEGARRIYHLDPGGLEGLRTYLEQFWGRSLASFADAARAEHVRTNAAVKEQR